MATAEEMRRRAVSDSRSEPPGALRSRRGRHDHNEVADTGPREQVGRGQYGLYKALTEMERERERERERGREGEREMERERGDIGSYSSSPWNLFVKNSFQLKR